MRAMSKKRRGQLAERRRVVDEVLERDGGCRATQVCNVQCSGSLDVHEIIPRSAWPGGWLVPRNCIAVCRAHHMWIDDHPRLAFEYRLHGYSWQRQA